jgi:23S rRNA-intervening sequence protein
VERKNKNRGYQQLRVWQDAITLYVESCRLYKPQAFEMKRVTGQAIASADSVHRNIAEGYCRRSIREYIQHLYIALSSLGVSAYPHSSSIPNRFRISGGVPEPKNLNTILEHFIINNNWVLEQFADVFAILVLFADFWMNSDEVGRFDDSLQKTGGSQRIIFSNPADPFI